MELEVQLQEKGVCLEVDKSVHAWLIKHGYDSKMGARPMSRVIQQKIKKPLAEELLFGELENGGYVKIAAVGDELVFETKQSSETSENV